MEATSQGHFQCFLYGRSYHIYEQKHWMKKQKDRNIIHNISIIETYAAMYDAKIRLLSIYFALKDYMTNFSKN